MKIIEIKKYVTNGIRVGHIIIDDINDNEEIEDLVDDWCYSDAAGQNRGWTSEWREITNTIDRGVIIMEEIRRIGNSIERLEKRKADLTDHLIVPFVEVYKK